MARDLLVVDDTLLAQRAQVADCFYHRDGASRRTGQRRAGATLGRARAGRRAAFARAAVAAGAVSAVAAAAPELPTGLQAELARALIGCSPAACRAGGARVRRRRLRVARVARCRQRHRHAPVRSDAVVHGRSRPHRQRGRPGCRAIGSARCPAGRRRRLQRDHRGRRGGAGARDRRPVVLGIRPQPVKIVLARRPTAQRLRRRARLHRPARHHGGATAALPGALDDRDLLSGRQADHRRRPAAPPPTAVAAPSRSDCSARPSRRSTTPAGQPPRVPPTRRRALAHTTDRQPLPRCAARSPRPFQPHPGGPHTVNHPAARHPRPQSDEPRDSRLCVKQAETSGATRVRGNGQAHGDRARPRSTRAFP